MTSEGNQILAFGDHLSELFNYLLYSADNKISDSLHPKMNQFCTFSYFFMKFINAKLIAVFCNVYVMLYKCTYLMYFLL